MKQHIHVCTAETSAAVTEYRNGASWRNVALALGYPASCASVLCGVAAGKPGQMTPAGEQDLRRRLGLSYDILHAVAVPHDANATMHVETGGTGRLDVVYVPDGTQVVMVPPGARVIQPKQPSKPARKRTRIDISGLPLNAEEARLILLWWLFRDERDDWPEWVKRSEQASE